MTTISIIRANKGTKMNHNETGLLIRPAPAQGSKMNHNEGGLKAGK